MLVTQLFHGADISYKFPLLGKSMSTHKDNGTTKHQFNDTNTLVAKFLSLFALKSKIITIIQKLKWAGRGLTRPCDQYHHQILSYGQIIFALIQIHWYQKPQSYGHTCLTFIYLFSWCQKKRYYHQSKLEGRGGESIVVHVPNILVIPSFWKIQDHSQGKLPLLNTESITPMSQLYWLFIAMVSNEKIIPSLLLVGGEGEGVNQSLCPILMSDPGLQSNPGTLRRKIVPQTTESMTHMPKLHLCVLMM